MEDLNYKDEIEKYCIKTLFSGDMLGIWEVFGDYYCNLCDCIKDTRGVCWDHDGNLVKEIFNDEILAKLIEIQGENPQPWRVLEEEVTNKQFPIPRKRIMIDLLLHGVVRVVGTFIYWDLRYAMGRRKCESDFTKKKRDKRLLDFQQIMNEHVNRSFLIPLAKKHRKKKQMNEEKYWSNVDKLSFEIPNLEGLDAWNVLMDKKIQDEMLGAIHGNDDGNANRKVKWRIFRKLVKALDQQYCANEHCGVWVNRYRDHVANAEWCPDINCQKYDCNIYDHVKLKHNEEDDRLNYPKDCVTESYQIELDEMAEKIKKL